MPLPPHIATAQDLVTDRADTQKGFLAQAKQKNVEAVEFCVLASKLKTALYAAKSIDEVSKLAAYQNDLLSACGFSTKSLNYFDFAEKATMLKELLKDICEKAGDGWRDDVLFRFMLTKGDTLGGRMRNLVGASASRLFTAAILRALEHRGLKKNDIAIAESDTKKVQAIAWANRIITFDKTPVFMDKAANDKKKNIDVLFLKSTSQYPSSSIGSLSRLLSDPKNYLACGELKGGIDPAGADEHWKTAASALERIRLRFPNEPKPKLFFVGAAIENAMAGEIFAELSDGRLTYAANLTNEQQICDLANWLANL